jgi:hypothetical protein
MLYYSEEQKSYGKGYVKVKIVLVHAIKAYGK